MQRHLNTKAPTKYIWWAGLVREDRKSELDILFWRSLDGRFILCSRLGCEHCLRRMECLLVYFHSRCCSTSISRLDFLTVTIYIKTVPNSQCASPVK